MSDVKQDTILDIDDKFKLVDEKTKLQKEEEATELIQDVGKQVYNIPRHDGELNLYKNILVNIQDETDRNDFINLFKDIEPNLINKNDIVQKVIISSVLYNKLFLLKHKDKDFDIFRILKGIEYKKDNGTWLELMLSYTIPFLVNNNILKDLNND